jgi:hypothetical protein
MHIHIYVYMYVCVYIYIYIYIYTYCQRERMLRKACNKTATGVVQPVATFVLFALSLSTKQRDIT